jgi:hypothetical protein
VRAHVLVEDRGVVEAGDEQVDPAVAVIVVGGGAAGVVVGLDFARARPLDVADAGGGGDVGEDRRVGAASRDCASLAATAPVGAGAVVGIGVAAKSTAAGDVGGVGRRFDCQNV